MPSVCKLCGASGPLIYSHILPDFFIRSAERLVPKGASGHPQRTSILLSTRPEISGGQMQRGYWEKQVGIKEYLLCAACELRFSRYENYFRTFFYGNAPPPLQKIPVGKPADPGALAGAPSGIIGARFVSLDYCQFKLFSLSLLWRAGVSSGDFFARVDLGPHEARVGAMLNAEKPGVDADYATMLIDLRFGADGLEDFIQQPDYGKIEGQRGYSFVLGGFMLIIVVGAAGHLPPHPLAKYTIKSSGDLVLFSAKADPMLKWWGARLKSAGRI